MTRLLVCGSRTWRDRERIRAVLLDIRPDVVIHGAHWEGADRIVADLCTQLGIAQEPYPANWREQGRPAGPRRNIRMILDGKPTRVVAFRTSGKSAGTDDCCRRARQLGIPVRVVTGAAA